jgi:hypothetical protein
MGVHPLGGQASIEVMSVRGSFAGKTPNIERHQSGERSLKFSTPADRAHTAQIKFRFRTQNVPNGFSFGIKQFCSVDWYFATYRGLKSVDGMISQHFRTPERWNLDVASQSLTVLFDSVTHLPTGARAIATQAPFYSEGAAFVKNGVEIELSIEDAPGGSYSLEMRNAATDRINYLHDVDVKESFLTVLTAVRTDGTHLPLEAAYWGSVLKGTVEWNQAGNPDVSKFTHTAAGAGSFPSIQPGFAITDFNLLANPSLRAPDCITQKFNDAMFRVRGIYQSQDFSKPTRAEKRITSGGYEIVQYPRFD